MNTHTKFTHKSLVATFGLSFLLPFLTVHPVLADGDDSQDQIRWVKVWREELGDSKALTLERLRTRDSSYNFDIAPSKQKSNLCLNPSIRYPTMPSFCAQEMLLGLDDIEHYVLSLIPVPDDVEDGRYNRKWCLSSIRYAAFCVDGG